MNNSRASVLTRVILISLIASTLWGCASINSNQRQQVSQLTAPESWRVLGKASVSDSETAQLFSYFWQYQPSYERLELNANNAGRIFAYERQGQKSKLSVAGREPVFDTEPNKVLQQQLGWQLPIPELRYWLVGVAYPESSIAAVEFNDDGRLMSLRQSGWDVSYRAYYIKQSHDLPKSIQLRKGRFSVRIYASNWQLPPEWVALRGDMQQH